MRFEVLGTTRAVGASGGAPDDTVARSVPLGGPKQRLVLALLLAEPNRVVSIDQLIDGVWGEDPPESARHTVQAYVSELRKGVGPIIERAGAGYRIRAGPPSLDSLDFESRIVEGCRGVGTDPEGAIDVLDEALRLWRGAPFGDLGHQPVLEAEAARLEELRLVAIEASMQARLAIGRHAEIVADLERLTREHPYREELRALHMIALYRSGRQAEALRAYRATREVLADDLGLVPSPRLRRLEEQILLQDPELDAPSSSPPPGGSDPPLGNPYVGLRAFREADHMRFFGQERLVERLLERVTGTGSFTAVVGPSGSGKSSAVQAGLVPRLRRDHPELAVGLMQPGTRPFGALATAFAGVAGGSVHELTSRLERPDGLGACAGELVRDGRRRLALVIDQFEELFTLADDTESRRFLDLLAQGVRDEPDAVHIVVTLRADFYDRPLAEPRFGRLFADNVITVAALGPDELAAAATLPARQLDVDVEPRLVGRLVADVAGQPNALPLFQYALTELFDARTGSVLDLATYERIGGVRKAIARRAESLYAQLDPIEQEVARQLFLRIATVSGSLVGRRRVPASELVALDLDVVALRNVIHVYTRHRLLVVDRDPASGTSTVEVAHEALLTEWHLLRNWIDRHRDDLSKQASFLAAIDEWESSRRDPGYLLHGSRLDAYREWAGSTNLRLTSTEQEFLDAAVATDEAAAAEVMQREMQRARLQRRARLQLVGLFVVAAVLAGLIAYPFVTASGEPERIVAVLGDSRDSSDFDALIARGVEAVGDSPGYEASVLQPPIADIRAEIEGASFVVAGSIQAERLFPLVDDFPETLFVLMDVPPEASAPNVVRLNFAAEQGSFLVGAAAALESATGKVGYIGANATPPIEAFRAGFETGARAANPEVEIVTGLIDDGVTFGYDRPDLAEELALDMFGRGVDVIYTAAGESGSGVVDAAMRASTSDRHLYAIGVDDDECFDGSTERCDHILTSMYKNIAVGIGAVVAAYDAGELAGGDDFVAGLADGAVGYTTIGGHLGDATLEQLERFRDRLLDGDIVVDPEPAEAWDLGLPTELVRIDVDDGAVSLVAGASGDIGYFAVSRTTPPRMMWRTPVDDLVAGGVDGGVSEPVALPDGSTERSRLGGAWSPDGTKIVLQDTVDGRDEFGRLIVHDLVTGTTDELVDLSRGWTYWYWLAPRFSHDGERVLYELARDASDSSRFDTWSVPITGGVPELEIRDAAFPVPVADGAVVVVSGLEGLFGPQSATIRIVDADGAVTDVVEIDHAPWHMSASPDGTRVVYVEEHGTDNRIRVVDLETGENRIVSAGEFVDWLDDETILVSRTAPT